MGNTDLISRKALLERMKRVTFRGIPLIAQEGVQFACKTMEVVVNGTPAVEPVITGETSDGYHTFNELYHHRAVLFSVIVKAFPEKAWKSRQHSDGSMFEGMFIVGIDTLDGPATYHYHLDPYWDMFACREIDRAPEWDGHTAAQAIERIRKLDPVRHGWWIQEYELVQSVEDWSEQPYVKCSECGHKEWGVDLNDYTDIENLPDYCQGCGAKMDQEPENQYAYADNDTAQYADNPTV